MDIEKIEPWYTEKYSSEREAEIDALIKAGKDPWRKEPSEQAKQMARDEALRNKKTIAEIERLGPEGFVIQNIKEIKKYILDLKNPTPEELYIYTDAFFRDNIKFHEETLLFYENLLKDKEKLEATINNYKDRLTKLENQAIENNSFQIPKTYYPNEFITPKDKVSNMLFNGELSKELQELRTERLGNEQELTAKVSIDFDELETIKLSNKNFTQYDREVHDAAVSLYIDGGNEFITPLMIYRTMTGNPNGKVTDKILNDVTESLDKCSITRVYIDATEEIKGRGYNIEQPIYKENLLYIRSIKGLHNGQMGEWIQIIEPPILYKYANSKNQVARMDIKLLNTPINKSEEVIMLQGYLQRRILSMKGSKLSRNILYDTVYKQLNIEAASPGALRKKQSKIRDNIKNILSYWKKESFIKDFKENTGPRNSKVSISIILE